jgi:hypothetical protein
MSRRRNAEVQNLDSLLDTMANVTGILVVLLAVTQISVGDAVERLRDQLSARPELSREAMTAAESEASELELALAPLLPDADANEALRRERRAELSALRTRIARLDRELAAARDAPRSAAELARRQEAARTHSQSLERAIATLGRENADLAQKLAAPAPAALPSEARLPDPRPAPAGAREVVFFVRHGRILPVDGEDMLRRLWAGIRAATGGTTPERLQGSALDRSLVLQYFQRNDVGSRELRWHVLDVAGTLVGQLGWRDPQAGETLQQISSGLSRYRADLLRLSPRQVYFQFFVWDDSFDVYVAARQLSDEAGFAAGWVPFDANRPFRQPLAHLATQRLID